MALYSLGPLIGKLSSLDNVCLSLSMFVAGPVIGPIAGGFIAQSIGVKWVFIIVAILCAVAAAVGIPVLKETYAPIIRLRLAKKSADPEKAAKQHPTLVAAHGSKLHLLWINLSRPIVILTHSFVLLHLELVHVAVRCLQKVSAGLDNSKFACSMYGLYYLMFATFPQLFTEVYGSVLHHIELCYETDPVGIHFQIQYRPEWTGIYRARARIFHCDHVRCKSSRQNLCPCESSLSPLNVAIR